MWAARGASVARDDKAFSCADMGPVITEKGLAMLGLLAWIGLAECTVMYLEYWWQLWKDR